MEKSDIVGIGTDIVNVERVRSIEKNINALKKLFTDDEIKYCAKMAVPAEHFAARFAGKEAVIKAINGINNKIGYKDIEIIIGKNKQPSVVIKKLPSARILISLSHEREFALATAIVVYNRHV